MITKAKTLLLALLCALLATAALAEGVAPDPTLAPPEGLRSVRIRAVGDVIAHEHQLKIAKQKDGSYTPATPASIRRRRCWRR